jgi:NAD-dependent SIR2 family protein deacetylase
MLLLCFYLVYLKVYGIFLKRMFAVEPKRNCPHLGDLNYESIGRQLDSFSILTQKCSDCLDTSENWMCLNCENVFCSRYVNGHMAVHNASSGHCVALSYSDASFWCYACDSYVTSIELAFLAKRLGDAKFPTEPEDFFESSPNSQKLKKERRLSGSTKLSPVPEGQEIDLENEMPVLASPHTPGTLNPSSLTYESLAHRLRNKQFGRVVFLTGAGISVAAGIPDFRTPGTGLYSRVEELGLPYPEAIFSLEFLKRNPQPFYSVANGFLTFKAAPVKSHHFIKRVHDEGMLLMDFTQNIDGLELDAGLPMEKLLQAHGHMRSARCCDCAASVPIETFFAHVAQEKVLFCSSCTEGTPTGASSLVGGASDTAEGDQDTSSYVSGVVKPDIVFFGESLPREFQANLMKIVRSDLVFIMGTSLKVFPFAGLVDLIPEGVPVVLVDRVDPGRFEVDNPNVLFLQGDIEDTIGKLAADIGWELPDSVRTGTVPAAGEKAQAQEPLAGIKA